MQHDAEAIRACIPPSDAIMGKDAPRPSWQLECVSHGEDQALFSKIGWGGPRANSGGARPGSGPKRKAKLLPSPGPSGPRWYCVATEPRLELRVIHHLHMMGFDLHCPLVREDARRVPELAFPGYVFVLLDIDDLRWIDINEPGFCHLLADQAGTPTPVRRGYVEGWIAAAGEVGYIDARPDAAPSLTIGARVRIIDGPFTGFTGTVFGTSGKWVKVVTAMFGRSTDTFLPRSAIEVC